MKSQWKLYQDLELLPDSLPESMLNEPMLAPWLQYVVQTIYIPLLQRRINDVVDHFSSPDAVAHLERCFETDTPPSPPKILGVVNRAWAFLNQPILGWEKLSTSEPQVNQYLDQAGHLWWRIYDPITGRRAELESEDEVRVWLEERPYHG